MLVYVRLVKFSSLVSVLFNKVDVTVVQGIGFVTQAVQYFANQLWSSCQSLNCES